MSQVIMNVDGYAVCEPMFEAARIVLSHRGETYSPAYIQGLSGAAFRIAGICPCAPTCSCGTSPEKLLNGLGYDVDLVSPMERAKLPEGDHDGEFARMMESDELPAEAKLTKPEYGRIAEQARAMNAAIKRGIDGGQPAVVWHAFTNAENDVVCGYDDAEGVWLGRGSYAGARGDYAKAKQYRCMRSQLVGGWPTAIILGQKVREPDLLAMELKAIREAVRHGRDPHNTGQPVDDGKWRMLHGVASYRRWVTEFATPGKKRGAGDAYCFGIYRDTHACAPAFLRQIAPGHPAISPHLERAADAFDHEAKTLAGGEKLLWWNSSEGPDATRDAAAHALLQEACSGYERGIDSLEQALIRLG